MAEALRGRFPNFLKQKASFEIEQEQPQLRAAGAAPRKLLQSGPRETAEQTFTGGLGYGQQGFPHGSAVFERFMQSGFGRKRPVHFGAKQVHVLADLVGVRVGEAGRVLAQLAGHAGDDDFTHAAATGRGQAFSYKVPDADESGGRQVGQAGFRAGFGATPVQNTMLDPPDRECDLTQIRMVWMYAS